MDLRPPFAVSVADAVLTPDELDPAQIISGEPRTSSLVLHESSVPLGTPVPGTAASGSSDSVSGDLGGRVIERGIWEITPGVVTDVEADEMFIVLSGRATIEFEDGSPTLNVGPGDVVVFPEGAVTRWTVHETLRKVYQLSFDAQSDA